MKETSWEYAGRSVAEATQIALEELGLEQDDIHVEILEEPQKGFLGLVGKEARIRVELIGEWEVLGKKQEAVAAAEEIAPLAVAEEHPRVDTAVARLVEEEEEEEEEEYIPCLLYTSPSPRDS